MPITDIFRVNQIKDELQRTLQERDALKATVAELGAMDAVAARLAIAALERRRDAIAQEVRDAEAEAAKKRAVAEAELAALQQKAAEKKKDLIVLDDEILLQSFGLYKPHYDFATSAGYKARLEQIQDRQADIIKRELAARATQTWSINGSAKEGARVVKDYIRLILRAFNNECEAAIDSVKFSNIDTMENRIRRAFETMNKLGERMFIEISREYVNLKLDELRLVFEYRRKKQEEKEEQRRIREQMREEEKVRREMDAAREKLEKEERHFQKAIQQLDRQLASADSDVLREQLNKERGEAVSALEKIGKDKLDVLNREQNTRAGYVYVISNIGAFGEDVYKIGVTRRLDPQERIDELGDASVPFWFDVHALIFSDDAPALENALHRAFASRRLNMINTRREFFKVPLAEIMDVVQKNFNKPVDFIETPEAEQFRESLRLRGG